MEDSKKALAGGNADHASSVYDEEMKRAVLLCVMLLTNVGHAQAPTASILFSARPAQTFLVSPQQMTLKAVLALAPHGQAQEIEAALVRDSAQDVLNLIKAHKLAPTRAARALALTLTAMNDVQTAITSSGRQLNANTAAAVAASRVLIGLFPEDAPMLYRRLQSRLAALSPGGDTVSWLLGDAVADQVLTFAASDGAAQADSSADLPDGEGTWQALSGQQSLDPGWGAVLPIGLTQQALPQVVAPPAWNSGIFAQDRQAFRQTQHQLTPADQALAAYWAAGSGTVTPLGMWIEKAGQLSQQYQLDGPHTLEILTLTAVAGHNAFIVCWHAKFKYNVARPENWLPQQETGWKPALPTPPFPSYPSGHATVSGAASQVLAAFFPTDAQVLLKDAQDAAYSRVVGGIHWALDGEGGLDAGKRVANALLSSGQ